jgi:hypothetical protein
VAEKGTARLERLKRREEGRVIREDHALRLFASGLTYEEITLDLADKAAKVVFDALDRYGAVTGAIKPPEKTTNITLINQIPPDADSKRKAAQAELLREAAKLVTIEGELANAGTSLHANRGADAHQSLLPPPPLLGKENP